MKHDIRVWRVFDALTLASVYPVYIEKPNRQRRFLALISIAGSDSACWNRSDETASRGA